MFGYQKKDKYNLVIRRRTNIAWLLEGRTNIDWLLEEGQI